MSHIKNLNPKQAFESLQSQPNAILLDVRDKFEAAFIGHPIGALNIPLKVAPDMRLNPNFVDEVKKSIPNPLTPIFTMCRGGQRSLEAAKALSEAGYLDLTNIEEGFEGPLNDQKHRSTVSGWRFHGLPWEQN